ncbi:MAG: hypothetical protein EAY66_03420 [Sphingobacteriales bacterium]|jgi:hypothetical protein|nr:MAG: hypothetical protein EAY66_03420 [Sphingobacteriales bacterium]
MNNAQKYKLIKGRFDAEEAIPLVTSLYEAKIQFHNRQLLTMNERNEEDVEHCEKRITDLEKTRGNIINLLKKAALESKKIDIDGFLAIEIV